MEDIRANDLMRDIEARERQEQMEDMIVPANFDDTLPDVYDPKNPMAASARQSAAVGGQSRLNEKDNMLKYQVSDNKEENDLLEGVMGSSQNRLFKNRESGNSDRKKDKVHKDGDIISTEQANRTVVAE